MVLTAHLHDDVQDFTFLKTEVNKHLNYSEGSFLAPRCCPPPPLLLCDLKAGPDLEMNEVQVGHTTERTSIKDIWTVRLNVIGTRASHHPALEHKAPPAVIPPQEPPYMAGKHRSSKRAVPKFLSHSHLVLEAPQVLVVPVKQKHGDNSYKSSHSYLWHILPITF